MGWLMLVLFFVIMARWCQNTSAIGLCEFALKFPLYGNERLEQCVHFGRTKYTVNATEMPSRPGSVRVESSSEPLAFTPTASKSTFGQSTERLSTQELFHTSGKTLLMPKVGHTKHTTSGREVPSRPGTVRVESSFEPIAFTSTALKSTHGQSTERLSSAELFHTSEKTLLMKSKNPGNLNLATTTNFVISTPACPPNMIYTVCGKCESTCQEPYVCYSSCSSFEKCVCPALDGFFMKDNVCVPMAECGCFIQGAGFISLNSNYTSNDCSFQCTCTDNELQCRPYLNCSPNARCEIQDGVGQCHCNEGFVGDGETCSLTSSFTDCSDVYAAGHTQDGVYPVSPLTWNGSPFDVFCRMTIDGGGWTVFHRRVNGSTDFYKSWADYRDGFGNNRHEFWLGNEKLYHILQQATYEVRVDTLMSVNGSYVGYYHKYKSFQIDDETNKYRVTDLGQWSGEHGGSMNRIKNMNFSTYDQDNDGLIYDCASKHRGGWWYGGVEWIFNTQSENCKFWGHATGAIISCTGSNPNGVYDGDNGEVVFLDPDYCNINYIEMKIRRKV